MKQIRDRADIPARELEDESFREGIKSVVFIRCLKHHDISQLNHSEMGGSECGACIKEKATEVSSMLLEACQGLVSNSIISGMSAAIRDRARRDGTIDYFEFAQSAIAKAKGNKP